MTLIKSKDARYLGDVFHSAPFDPDGWDTALRCLAEATGARCGQLIAFGSERDIPLNWVTDPEPGFVEEFAAIDGGNHEVNWRVASAGKPMELRWERHYDQARRGMKCEIYDEFAHRFDLQYGCQTTLFQTSEVFYGLASLRSRGDGRTTASSRKAFATIAPHVATAIRLQLSIEHQGAQLIAGALDSVGGAAILLDCSGRVIAQSSSADRLLTRGIGLRVKRKKLNADDPEVDRRLQYAIGRAIKQDLPPPTPAPPFWLSTKQPREIHGLCEVLPLPRQEWNLGHSPQAIVTIQRPSSLSKNLKAPLKALLGLTDAEAEVALMTANGSSREHIAFVRGTAENTVASQLKQIFLKSDVKREAELVALVNRILR